jgi:hypothetical protein
LYQEIKPSFWYVNEISDAVSLGFNYEIGFTISSESEREKTTTTTITRSIRHDGDLSQNYKDTSVKVEDTLNQDVTEFGVESAIGFGVTWKVKPDRFTLNFGVGINLPDYTSETTHTKPTEATITKVTRDYDDGRNTSSVDIDPTTVDATDTTVVAQNWSAVGATYSLGGTFYFTPNFLVDMYFDNVSGPAALTTGNIGGTAASLVDINCSLLFTLKY